MLTNHLIYQPSHFMLWQNSKGNNRICGVVPMDCSPKDLEKAALSVQTVTPTVGEHTSLGPIHPDPVKAPGGHPQTL